MEGEEHQMESKQEQEGTKEEQEGNIEEQEDTMEEQKLADIKVTVSRFDSLSLDETDAKTELSLDETDAIKIGKKEFFGRHHDHQEEEINRSKEVSSDLDLDKVRFLCITISHSHLRMEN